MTEEFAMVFTHRRKVESPMGRRGLMFGSLVLSLGLLLISTSAVEAAFVPSIADVSDIEDPDGNDANMAAGGFPGNDLPPINGETKLSDVFGDLDWTFVEEIGGFGEVTSGSFALPVDVSGVFAFALKADGHYSLYKFVGDYMAGDVFTFTTAGVAVDPNDSSKFAAASHVALYTGTAVVPELTSFLIWTVLGYTFVSTGRVRRCRIE